MKVKYNGIIRKFSSRAYKMFFQSIDMFLIYQITHLNCFSVFIINFADIKSNFPLSGPYL